MHLALALMQPNQLFKVQVETYKYNMSNRSFLNVNKKYCDIIITEPHKALPSSLDLKSGLVAHIFCFDKYT